MKNRHVTKLLDRTKFDELSAAQIAEIEAHAEICSECRRAFQTARIAALLLRESAAAPPPAPNPFFEAKVLNAWRERQNSQKPSAVFRRWWQASAMLVSMMFLTVIGLITMTLVGSHHQSASDRNADSNAVLYSTETVILNQKSPRPVTTEQVYEFLDEDN